MAQPKKTRFFKSWFRAVGFWISLGLSLIVILLYLFFLPETNRGGTFTTLFGLKGFLDGIEAKSLDLRFSLRGKRQPSHQIVIIGVDEKTDDALGRWQTSGRKWIAKMVDILSEGGARAIGFDVSLAEPDEGAALVAVEEIKTRLNEIAQGEGSPAQPELLTYLEEIKAQHDYDRLLAEAIQRHGNVVLGIYHFFDPQSAAHLTPEKQDAHHQLIKRSKFKLIKFPAGHTRAPLPVPHSFGVEADLPMLSEAAKSFGHFNVSPASDGYIRKAPLIVEYQGEYYPSLNLELTRLALNPSPLATIVALGQQDVGVVNYIQLGDLVIPTDEEGRLLINFYGPGYTFPHYSIADVVLGKIPPATFQDKIVLFGFTSMIYQDVHSTSFEATSYPGVEVHATIIENILQQEFLQQPQLTMLIDALVILSLALILGVLLHRVRSVLGGLTAILCLVSVVGITYAAFLYQKIWLNLTFPVLFILLDYVAITSYKYFTEEKKKREVKNAFQHYVSPAIVEQMIDQIDQLHLGGERKELTALFSDIRGFTSISEKMEPEALAAFLNEYLSAMTKIVLRYEGTVDKYMGDAIMAFYGAPLFQADHAVRACKTAVEMMTRLQELRAGWEARGLPPMNIGIGLNSGEMSVGNMGSEERFNYTIMGDNVNLASRLEGINKQYGTNIVISQFTYDLVQQEPFLARELDLVRVKGKQQPVRIYELLSYGPPDQTVATLVQTFCDGLAAYQQQHWEQAQTLFQEALRIKPGDSPSALYLKRCHEFRQTPPPEKWDGVFEMKTK